MATTPQAANTSVSQPRIKLDLRTLSFILIFLALVVSGYLTYVKLTDTAMACVHGGKFDCGVVQNSAYSEIFGVPIAVYGFITNWVVLGLLVASSRIPFFIENGLILVFGVVFFEFIYSVYLVYVQHFLLKAYCPWCLSHEAIITLLFIVISARVWKYFSTVEE